MFRIFVLAGIFFILFSNNLKAEWQTIKPIGIVIHHSGSENDSIKSIEYEHVRIRKWKTIGYHAIIDKHGIVHQFRPYTAKGAHDKGSKYHKGRNSTHIGICLLGDKNFTTAQKNSLVSFCQKLKSCYNIREIKRHHEECPGKGLNVEEIEREIL